MKDFVLSMRLLVRDWHSGEIRVLALAVIIAVASICAVGFFTDRIAKALELQANELLGADLVVTASSPIQETYLTKAHQHGLKRAVTAQFPSMVMSEGKHHIASIKSVSEGYPLRGHLRVADELFAPDRQAKGIPPMGEVWVESRLLSALGLSVGDRLSLGLSEFRVGAVLTSEPARAGGNVFSLAPALLLNSGDLLKTKLITPASRVRYSVLFSGDNNDVAEFRKWLEAELPPGYRIQGIDDARPEVKSALDKAGRFLGLAALVSVMLACVAVAMAARRFVSRHLDNCAIMRCFGATQGTILRLYTLQMVYLGLIASFIGVLLGFLAQFLLVGALAELSQVHLPIPSLTPAISGLLVGMVTLLGFTYPTLTHLRDVPTLRVLRRDLGGVPPRSYGAYLLGISTLVVLVLWQARDLMLGLYMSLGLLLTFGLLAGVAFVLLRCLGKIAPRVSVKWRFAINNIFRRMRMSVIQIVAFGLGLMVLLILTVVRGDLLAEWDERLPENTPNRFLINIQTEQVDAVRAFLKDELAYEPIIHPMIRARLHAINGKPVNAKDFENERAQRLIQREFNLSWTDQLPPENTLVKGQWWGEGRAVPAFSVEEGLAKTLGLDLGDQLSFSVAGETFAATVTNLRHVEWDNFRVNFFVIAPDGYLNDYPVSFITSFYLPAEQYSLLNEMLRQFPNITVIDVAAVLKQVRRIINQVMQTIEYVFIFTLLAGIMVLYAAIQSTLDERMREAAILRTLGATRRQVLTGVMIEFAFLGGLSGAIAAVAANGVCALLAYKIFNLAYSFSPLLWLSGAAIGILVVSIAGVVGTRNALRLPPLVVLKEL